MNKYFKSCKCIEDLKEYYRTLAMQNHPDRGGSLEIMQAINGEYDFLFSKLKDVHRSTKPDAEPFYTATKSTTEQAHEFREIIEKLIILEGLKVELIGRWIWVTGETKPHKDTFKALGFKWCSKKVAWSWHFPEDGVSSRGKYDLNKIRNIYGSTEFGNSEQKLRLA